MQTAKLLIRKRYYEYVLFLIPEFIVQVTELVQFVINVRKFHRQYQWTFATHVRALRVVRLSMFGICEDVRHFSQHSYNITMNSHNSQLTLPTDSHGSDMAQQGGREGQYWAPKPNYCRVKWLYLGNRSE